jgi:hypothetical protein
MRQFLTNYEMPEPVKPKFKPYLLLALAVAVGTFCYSLFSR